MQRDFFSLLTLLIVGASFWGCGYNMDYYAPYDPMPKATSIVNPYDGIDFENTLRLKANLHTHTKASDGNRTASEMIRAYWDRSYDVLAITDHEKHYEKETDFVDISDRKILVIRGAEITMTHHFNSLFTDHGKIYEQTVEAAIKSEIAKAKSVIVLNHPGRHKWLYPVDWYVDLYQKFPKEHLVGQEVVNSQDDYPSDKQLWDLILTKTAPLRTVYGYANDDSHAFNEIGYSYNELLTSEFTVTEVRNAITHGRSFFYSNATISKPIGKMPHVIDVIVDQDDLTIEVVATDYHKIEWFSCNRIVSNQNKISINGNVDRSYHLGRYIRFVLTGSGGQLFSQPFLIL